MNYEPYAPLGELPLPPGVVLPTGFPQIGDLAKQLGLKTFGVYTPWAARTSGVSWEPVSQPPDTNIAVFAINDALLAAAQALAWGQPIPFVAVLTEKSISPEVLTKAFGGTPYKFYETQAVYKQSDSAPTPHAYFLHWAENRQPGDAGSGKTSLAQAAAQVGGALTYSIQVNYNTTSARKPPGVSFQSALESQMANEGPVPPPPPPPSPPPPTEPPPTKASMAGPLLVGTGVAVATFLVVREMRKGKR